MKLVILSILFTIASSVGCQSAIAESTFMTRLEQGERLNIAAIGTSLTATSFNTKNWFAQMGDWLKDQYPGQVTLNNRAVSGTASANLPEHNRPMGGFAQLDQTLANDNPDVIFIEFAINDSYKAFKITPAKSKKNLQTMIDTINKWAANKGKKVEIIVQTMNNMGPGAQASYGNDVAPYYEAYRQAAKENDLLLIDHHANWMKLYDSEKDHAKWKMYVPDGLHPNPLGTTKVILPEIQKVLKRQMTAPQSK